MKFYKTPVFAPKFFPKRNWSFSLPESEGNIFLTFDDGPHPDITPLVLDFLVEHGLKATFFCVGENVKRYPDIYSRILREGHAVGNHTMHHKNALKYAKQEYLMDVDEAALFIQSSLFRPPYGRLDVIKEKELLKRFKIVMWSFLTYDYDEKVPLEKVKDEMQKLKDGDVVLMHDNVKSKERSLELLAHFAAICKQKYLKTAVIYEELCK